MSMRHSKLRHMFQHVSVQNIKIIIIKMQKELCLWKERVVGILKFMKVVYPRQVDTDIRV